MTDKSELITITMSKIVDQWILLQRVLPWDKWLKCLSKNTNSELKRSDHMTWIRRIAWIMAMFSTWPLKRSPPAHWMIQSELGGNLTPRTSGAIDALLGADRNRLKYLLSKPYRGQLTHFLARELKLFLMTDGLW